MTDRARGQPDFVGVLCDRRSNKRDGRVAAMLAGPDLRGEEQVAT